MGKREEEWINPHVKHETIKPSVPNFSGTQNDNQKAVPDTDSTNMKDIIMINITIIIFVGPVLFIWQSPGLPGW